MDNILKKREKEFTFFILFGMKILIHMQQDMALFRYTYGHEDLVVSYMKR